MPAITAHAEKRLQQRAIPPEILDMLWEFGTVRALQCG